MRSAMRGGLYLILGTFLVQSPFAAMAADRPLKFNYEAPRSPGKVARQENIAELNLTLATYANGVRLNLRPSTSEPGYFRLRVVFPINATHAGDYPPLAVSSANKLFLSNLIKHTHEEIFNLLTAHQVELEIRVDQGTPRLGMSGPTGSLPFALQLLTTWLSDQQTRALTPAGDYIPRPVTLKFNQLAQDPSRLALWKALYIATEGDARLGRPGPWRIPLPSAEISEWMESHLVRAPLEVGLVGDLEVDKVVALAATTVGSLDRRVPIPRRPLKPLAGPKKHARLEDVSEYFSPDISVSCLLWPLVGGETPGHTAAIEVASASLRDAVVRAAGEVLQSPVTSRVWIHRDPVQRDFAFVAMLNQFPPAHARKLTLAIISVAAKLAATGVSEAEFTRVRDQLRAQRVADRQSNQWWLDNVAWAAQTHAALLAEAKVHESVLDSLRLADVNDAARVFAEKLSTAVILHGAQPADPAARKKDERMPTKL